ncbi:MAG: diaminopimelate decarboxylase, partial [Pseudomonadota bacterium]
MRHFDWLDGILHCEQISLEDIAKLFSTPCYVYSQKTIEENYLTLKTALEKYGLRTQIHFALKANSNFHILKCLSDLKAGGDIVSQGEMMRAQQAGIKAETLVFSGVGKMDSEIAAALKQNIG